MLKKEGKVSVLMTNIKEKKIREIGVFGEVFGAYQEIIWKLMLGFWRQKSVGWRGISYKRLKQEYALKVKLVKKWIFWILWGWISWNGCW